MNYRQLKLEGTSISACPDEEYHFDALQQKLGSTHCYYLTDKSGPRALVFYGQNEVINNWSEPQPEPSECLLIAGLTQKGMLAKRQILFEKYADHKVTAHSVQLQGPNSDVLNPEKRKNLRIKYRNLTQYPEELDEIFNFVRIVDLIYPGVRNSCDGKRISPNNIGQYFRRYKIFPEENFVIYLGLDYEY